MQRFQAGLAFKAHRLSYHSTLELIVIKKKKSTKAFRGKVGVAREVVEEPGRHVEPGGSDLCTSDDERDTTTSQKCAALFRI